MKELLLFLSNAKYTVVGRNEKANSCILCNVLCKYCVFGLRIIFWYISQMWLNVFCKENATTSMLLYIQLCPYYKKNNLNFQRTLILDAEEKTQYSLILCGLEKHCWTKTSVVSWNSIDFFLSCKLLQQIGF